MIERSEQKGDLMGFIKRMFAAIFSTEFLIKILLIASILAVLDYLDRGLRISLTHNIYGGFEVTVKEKR